jgi:hypothetical protein
VVHASTRAVPIPSTRGSAQTFAFRLMMGGGLGKVTGGDDSWLDFTAM